MRIVLALATLAISTSAWAEPSPKPSRLALLCKHSGDHNAGLNKICYYQCGGVEGGGITRPLYDECPHWIARWRLNHNSQFGPRASSR